MICRRSRPAAVGLAAVFALLIAGCEGAPVDQEGPETGGPLAPPAEVGGVAITPPLAASQGWSGSFSGLPLCLEDSGRKVRVTDVRTTAVTGQVDEVRVFIGVGREPEGELIFVSALGSAPGFSEPYAAQESEHVAQFEFIEDLSSFPVEVECDGGQVSAAQPNLVVTFATGPAGGSIREWEVLYEAGGERFTTGPVPWEMTLCGTDPDLREVCPA